MKEFIERWNNDHKFKTSVQLSIYTLFFVSVAIFAVSNNSKAQLNDPKEENNLNISQEDTNEINPIKIPENYNYTQKITINDTVYEYVGSKTKLKETITKKLNDTSNNYIYENNNYYQEENGIYVLTTKEKVYDEVKYEYLDLDIINQYLSKSVKQENQYQVYLKDIILGNNSEEYIAITINESIIIDYTQLIKNFDNSITKYLVEIELEEIE